MIFAPVLARYRLRIAASKPLVRAARARPSRLFLALLASDALKLLCIREREILVRDKANERNCSLCATMSEFNDVSG